MNTIESSFKQQCKILTQQTQILAELFTDDPKGFPGSFIQDTINRGKSIEEICETLCKSNRMNKDNSYTNIVNKLQEIINLFQEKPSPTPILDRVIQEVGKFKMELRQQQNYIVVNEALKRLISLEEKGTLTQIKVEQELEQLEKKEQNKDLFQNQLIRRLYHRLPRDAHGDIKNLILL